MHIILADKLRKAEVELGFRFPKKLFNILRKLDNSILTFGDSSWHMALVTEAFNNEASNSFISNSKAFKSIWGLTGIVIAENTYKDQLLLLQGKDGKILKEIFVLLADGNQIKVLNFSLEKLIAQGPLDYASWEDCYLKLIDGIVIPGGENPASRYDDE